MQAIYEEHAGEAWDVFISPIMIDETSMINWDHLPDDGLGISISDATELLGGVGPNGSWASKASVDIVEHALIAAFCPVYNDLLKSWSPANPSLAMRRIRDLGIRLLVILLGTRDGLARYRSPAMVENKRSAVFYYGLTPSPTRPRLKRVDILSSSDPVLQMAVASHMAFEQSQEFAEASIRWFGDEAPSLRKPNELHL